MYSNRILLLLFAGLFFLVTLATSAFANYKLFLVFPEVWPDEIIFGDIAINLLRHNVVGTQLWGETVPGVTQCACWYPPVLFYLIAFVFSLFGVSIESQRLLPIVAYAGFLIALGLYLRLLLRDRIINSTLCMSALLLILGVVLTDYWLQIAARISRPEVFVMCFGMFSVYFGEKSFWLRERERPATITAGLCGFFLAMASLTHTFALIFVIPVLLNFFYRLRLKVGNSKEFRWFLIFWLVPVMWWLLSLGANAQYVIAQYQLIGYRRQFLSSWFRWYFDWRYGLEYVLFTMYFVVSILFLLYSVYARASRYFLVIVLVVTAWVITVLGGEHWYAVYVIPVSYVAMAIMLAEGVLVRKAAFFAKFVGIVFLLMLCLNVWLLYLTLQNYRDKDYVSFAREVSRVIPENKAIFLSVIPDVYYALLEKKPIAIYKFPDFAISEDDYRSLLAQSDYVVYTQTYNADIFPGFLERYLQENASPPMVVAAGGYSANVYVLIK